ncbi:hypothetical protein [Haloglomus litoreum]|uniref:hypothetical protein n=1 Tax=Haloglomus litoreum TaxID=3034026 RepID=UPI0023E7E0C9|nr:hypothetical protein [Haloglomus sp. DT116]
MSARTIDGVRRRVTERDEQLLAYLARVDLALPPKVLYHNVTADTALSCTERTLKRRLAVLDALGLTELVPETDGYRRITADGRERVEGER